MNLEGSRGNFDIEGSGGGKRRGNLCNYVLLWENEKKGLRIKVHLKYQHFFLIEVIKFYSSYLYVAWNWVHRSWVMCSDTIKNKLVLQFCKIWYYKIIVNCELPKAFGDDIECSDI